MIAKNTELFKPLYPIESFRAWQSLKQCRRSSVFLICLFDFYGWIKFGFVSPPPYPSFFVLGTKGLRENVSQSFALLSLLLLEAGLPHDWLVILSKHNSPFEDLRTANMNVRRDLWSHTHNVPRYFMHALWFSHFLRMQSSRYLYKEFIHRTPDILRPAKIFNDMARLPKLLDRHFLTDRFSFVLFKQSWQMMNCTLKFGGN